MKRSFRNLLKKKKKANGKKDLQQFQEMQISDDESKKRVSSLANSVESIEISSSSSEWKTDSDKLFVTCLNNNSENKIGNQLKITCIFLLILV